MRCLPGIGPAVALMVGLTGCFVPHMGSVTVSPDDRPILFHDVTVFAPAAGLTPHQDVLVRGKLIESVNETAEQSPADARIVDGRGKTLLPGLIDMHTHLYGPGAPYWMRVLPRGASRRAAYLSAFLYAGVTTILVASSVDLPADVADADRADGGEPSIPRLFLAGKGLTAPGGHPTRLTRALVPWLAWPLVKAIFGVTPTADGEDAAGKQFEESYRRWPLPFYKVFYDQIPDSSDPTSQISARAMRAVVDAAQARGVRVLAHVGSSKDFKDAVDAGISVVMHPPYRDVFESSLRPEEISAVLAQKVPFVTTVRLFSSSCWARPTSFESESVDPKVLSALEKPPADWRTRDKALNKWFKNAGTFDTNLHLNVRYLVDHGVPFLPGTDTGAPGIFPGTALLEELEALVDLLGGKPASEERKVWSARVLKAATLDAANVLDPTGARKLGRIEAGYAADLVLVKGDPVDDIRNLTCIEAVVRAGRWLDRHAVSASASPAGSVPASTCPFPAP